MKIKTSKKIELSIILIAIFQIVLLMNMGVAQSYIIHQGDSLGNSKVIDRNDKGKRLINSGLNLLTGFLSIKQIGFVSAQDIDLGAAQETCCIVYGDQDTQCYTDSSIIDQEACQGNPPEGLGGVIEESKCEDIIDKCAIGCCVDPDGFCGEGSPKGKCEEDGGTWSSTDNVGSCANVEMCEWGCCTSLQITAIPFTTRLRCERDSIPPVQFSLIGEAECRHSISSQEEGACIKSGTCSFGTATECNNAQGQFQAGLLCSHSSLTGALNIDYLQESSLGCVEGKDEIYWFDSEGNRENIYDAYDATGSWHDGIVWDKSLTCDYTQNNIGDTQCGNCNSLLGSMCSSEAAGNGVDDSNFICKSLNCVDAPSGFKWVGNERMLQYDTFRRNGETWCIYDSAIGGGKDTVGSEHWEAKCIQGEVTIDLCGSMRSEICEETVTDIETELTEDNGVTLDKTYSQARCAPNLGSTEVCLGYMDEDADNEEIERNCNTNPHCMFKEVNVDEYFTFALCVPRYPEGAEVVDEVTGLRGGETKCDFGSVACTVVYVGTFDQMWSGAASDDDKWKAKANEACESDLFAQEMNDLCISLGDCGSYINYIGNGSDNIRISGEDLEDDTHHTEDDYSLKWQDYINNKKPVAGEYVNALTYEDAQNFIGGVGDIASPDMEDVMDIGAWGAIAPGIGMLGGAGASIAFWKATYSLGGNAWRTSTIGSGGGISAVLAPIIGAIIGAYIGSKLAKELGISGPAAGALIGSSAAAGAATAAVLVTIAKGGTASGNPVGLGIAVIAAALATWIAVSGWGKSKERAYEFTCKPWQAPLSGKNCEECHKDSPLIRCTKYKCQSLGQRCEYLNSGTDNPLCIGTTDTPVPAIISFVSIEGDNDFVEEGAGATIDTTNDKGILELTTVDFVLETKDDGGEERYTSCKWTLDPLAKTSYNYDYMENQYSDSGENFATQHKFSVDLPDIYSAEDITGNMDDGFKGEVNMYVRCKDPHDIYNTKAYIVQFKIRSGPDVQVVDHTHTTFEPSDGSYLKYGQTEQDIIMWINEPATCKYDYIENTDYDKMTYEMEGDIDWTEKDDIIKGWSYTATLSNLTKDENKIYIKCNDTHGNTNVQDHSYTLYKSESELRIDSVDFKTVILGKTYTTLSGETITIGNLPSVSIDLNVRTAGGMENTGESTCSWGVEGQTYLFRPWDYSNTHTQTLAYRIPGENYGIHIICKDNALDGGNVVETDVSFSVEGDRTPPIATRVFNEGGILKLITNEEAECYYDLNRCNFNFENATSMTSGFSTIHSATWIPGQTYHVKCGDAWGNKNDPNCILTVSSTG